MQKLLALLVCFAFSTALTAQNSLNMTRLAHWDDDSLPVASPNNLRVQYSGCWGIAVNGHEYAILGGARHVLIFDVTTPADPVLKAKFEGNTNTVWREFKSYKNRVYGVTDGTSEGMMIFDFSQAPDTIRRSYWSNEFFSSAHTITLDTVSGRIYLNGTNVVNNGMLVLDVHQNPDKPQLLSSQALLGGYIHDSYVRGDTIYASSGYSGFYIYDFTDPDSAKVLASLPATIGYQHNNWLNKDGRYAYCTEEIPSGRPIIVVDLQDLANANIEVVKTFLDPLMPPGAYNAIPHNVYIKDDLLFDSQYEDGLLVYDISNPVSPQLIAYYDTHPENTQYNTYYGCWGNYPWLPSGTIIAGDMQNGLQLLKITSPPTPTSAPEAEPAWSVFPNPAHDRFTVRFSGNPQGGLLCLYGLSGQLLKQQVVLQDTAGVELDATGFPAGLYFCTWQPKSGPLQVKKIGLE